MEWTVMSIGRVSWDHCIGLRLLSEASSEQVLGMVNRSIALLVSTPNGVYPMTTDTLSGVLPVDLRRALVRFGRYVSSDAREIMAHC